MDGDDPLVELLGLDPTNKHFEFLKQLRIPLKVIVVELHPETNHIQYPGNIKTEHYSNS